MRISMWMIADYLEEAGYQLTVNINEGIDEIQNIRIFSSNTKLSRYTVYLDQVDDRVICIHGHDMIYLTHNDVNQILNELLDFMELLNEWSGTADEKIRNGCSIEELLDYCAELVPYDYLVADASFYVWGEGGDRDFNPVISRVIESRLMPLDVLLSINRKPNIRLMDQKPYLVELEKWNWKTCVTNLFLNSIHKGWLIANNKSCEFSNGFHFLLEKMGHKVEKWLSLNQTQVDTYSKNEPILEILSDTVQDVALLKRKLEGYGWEERDPKAVYVLEDFEQKSNTITTVLMHHFEKALTNTFVLRYDGHLLIVANFAIISQEHLEMRMDEFLLSHKMIAGSSPVFDNIFNLRINYETALIAVRYASNQSKRLFTLQDVVLAYIRFVIKNNAIIKIGNPELEKIKNYDRQHGSSLYGTLKMYLQNERRINETAQALYIHRSTLKYRIEKIEEIADLELDDFNERMYCLLCFILDETDGEG